jgi:energy-coupling factor transporter ATP-binding protein EcfA2
LIQGVTSLIKDTPQLTTTSFKSYEKREEAFRKSVFSLIPRKYSGPRLFWKDFTDVSLDKLTAITKHPIAYITSNPRDGLAFGTPWQVLRAALMCAHKAKGKFKRSVEEVAGEFGIHDCLHQPIRTLSGGETVKLALAKASVAAGYTDKLIIASPFSWLSRENSVFFQKLFDRCRRLEVPVELFALEGENSDQPIIDSEFPGDSLKDPIDFSLRFEHLRIPLGSSLNPIYSRQIHARVGEFKADLDSPCLIVGENGRGKSLIAKILAGALSYEGTAEFIRREKSGPPRLLFQDVISQTLLRSFNAIADSAANVNGVKPLEIYNRLITDYWEYGMAPGDEDRRKSLSGGAGHWSLLEVKAMLMAVRLCGQPRALILDEPDWGLTRTSAVALVAAAIKEAHAFGIPVVLISHKPWWLTVAKSIIRVDRTPKAEYGQGKAAFEIRLSRDGC